MHFSRITLALSGTLALLFCAGCATPGAPLPPSLELPRPVEDLSYMRKGNRLLLTWTPPRETTDKTAVRQPSRTWVCRAIGQYPISECVDVVKRLSEKDLQLVKAGQREVAVLEQTLTPQMLAAGGFSTYAVEVFNDRGRAAGLSNQVRVPLAPAMPAASDFRAKVKAEGIELAWTSSTQPGAAQGVSYTYRLQRKRTTDKVFATIQELPATGREKSFTDTSFDWESAYNYKVVGVTQIAQTAGAPIEIEGDDSVTLTVLAHDVFPPVQPSGVQAVFSSVGQKPFIDLTWFPNSEPDLAGYNVWRREVSGKATKINSQLIKAPSFRDEQVTPGATYFYSVSAVDLRGNESPLSEETSESVPR